MSDTILSLTTDRGDAALVQMTRDLQRDLARADVPARTIEVPPRPGEKGDAFSIGQLVLTLVTSGAVTALIECAKAYLGRDRTLSVKIKRPDGTEIELSSHNVDSTEVRAQLDSLVPAK
jgi:hypothetical protein